MIGMTQISWSQVDPELYDSEERMPLDLHFPFFCPAPAKNILSATDKRLSSGGEPNSPTLRFPRVTEHHSFPPKQHHQISHDIVAQHVDGSG